MVFIITCLCVFTDKIELSVFLLVAEGNHQLHIVVHIPHLKRDIYIIFVLVISIGYPGAFFIHSKAVGLLADSRACDHMNRIKIIYSYPCSQLQFTFVKRRSKIDKVPYRPAAVKHIHLHVLDKLLGQCFSSRHSPKTHSTKIDNLLVVRIHRDGVVVVTLASQQVNSHRIVVSLIHQHP